MPACGYNTKDKGLLEGVAAILQDSIQEKMPEGLGRCSLNKALAAQV